jgi:hypothetical protein
MTPDQFQEFRQRLRSNFRGSEAEDDVLLLSDGAKLNNATMSGQDAQLVEQANYSTKQIAQITSVHPHYLFDDKDGKYNTNAEQAGIDVLKYTFRPWLELIDDELTAKLLTDAEQDQGLKIRLDASVIARGDSSATTSTAVAQTNAGLRTPNEARALLELPPDADPSSDKLRPPLGSTGKGAAADPDPLQDPQGSGKQNSSRPAGNAGNAFAVLQPIIEAACARVDAKTTKAFANAQGKAPADRTIWANVFAEEQARYVTDALTPIAATLRTMDATSIDIPKISQRYAAAVRKLAATGETASLLQIAKNVTGV